MGKNKKEEKVNKDMRALLPAESGNKKIRIELDKKIKFNEINIERVELDFEALTGKDICEAETEYRGEFYQPILDPNYSMAYQAAIAAKASSLPYEVILELGPKDFTKVVDASKGFLMKLT